MSKILHELTIENSWISLDEVKSIEVHNGETNRKAMICITYRDGSKWWSTEAATHKIKEEAERLALLANNEAQEQAK
jgi:hypothetical protein